MLKTSFIRKIINPLPEDQGSQGFKPNFYILGLRFLCDLLIRGLRLHGRSRFSNEFIQRLDPLYVASLPDGTVLKFRTGHGRLLWRAKTFLDEEPMLVNWIQSFKKDDCFYDIGANVGGYSLIAASRGVRTVAIEAEMLNASLLYENIHLNDLHDTCILVPFALGRETKLDRFFVNNVSRGDALNGLGVPSYMLEDPQATTEVPALAFSLDDLVNRFGLPLPTQIKIDVDSNELDILLGSKMILEKVTGIYVEIDTEYEKHRKIVTFLGALGFEIVEEEPIQRKWRSTLKNYRFKRLSA